MPKRPGSFRTTISVPADLKRRMDAVKQPVNWSALACRAFEEKVTDIAAKKEKNDMADIIIRLRASKQRGANALYQEGHADGRRWASEQAQYDDLVRLEELHIKKGNSREWDDFFNKGHMDFPRAHALMRIICPLVRAPGGDLGDIHFDVDGWHMVCKDFWKSFVGDDEFKIEEPSYVRGFAEGALAVWSEVKDKL